MQLGELVFPNGSSYVMGWHPILGVSCPVLTGIHSKVSVTLYEILWQQNISSLECRTENPPASQGSCKINRKTRADICFFNSSNCQEVASNNESACSSGPRMRVTQDGRGEKKWFSETVALKWIGWVAMVTKEGESRCHEEWTWLTRRWACGYENTSIVHKAKVKGTVI